MYNKTWFDSNAKNGDMLEIEVNGSSQPKTVRFLSCDQYNDYGLENEIVSFERQYKAPDERYKHFELKWMKDAVNVEEIRAILTVNGEAVKHKSHKRENKKGEKVEEMNIRNETPQTQSNTVSVKKGEKGDASNTIVCSLCGGTYQNNANSKWYHKKSKKHIAASKQ